MPTNTNIEPAGIGALTALAPVAERARSYATQAKAPNTLRAYNADWRDFSAWCDAAGLIPMPAEGLDAGAPPPRAPPCETIPIGVPDRAARRNRCDGGKRSRGRSG